MQYLVTAIVFVLIFSLLILIHELGHFLMAKRAGIKVEEFGMGLPPRLWGKKKGETIYSINWIPFGGFVRMLGEDAADPKMLKKKRSFAAQPMRARVAVIVAGVVMNFLLAWILMVIGFTVGMDPLLLPDEVLPAIKNQQIVLSEGAKVESIEPSSLAEQSGVRPGDVIYSIGGELVRDVSDLDFTEPGQEFEVVRDGQIFPMRLRDQSIDDLGIQFADLSLMPRVEVFGVEFGTPAFQAGLRGGDKILSVNGEELFFVSEFRELANEPNVELEIYRRGQVQKLSYVNTDATRVIVSRVLEGGPADLSGFRSGDVILAVNNEQMYSVQGLIDFVRANGEQELTYLVERAGGNRVFINVMPENGQIGVLLASLENMDGHGLEIFNSELLQSVEEVVKEKYSFPVALYKGAEEVVTLSKVTAQMFVSFVSGLITGGEVPDSVAGPVGIAQLTHGFVQEGIVSLLRFVAILSLSLGVINILPFPALDGGRLLFIIVEFITGRRVDQKWESMIHALGYVLIILLILAVTYSDIVRIFGGG